MSWGGAFQKAQEEAFWCVREGNRHRSGQDSWNGELAS
jgi:hypothetical protein